MLKKTGVIAIGVIIVVSMLSALNRLGEQLTVRLDELEIGHLFFALLAYLSYFILNALGWVFVLRALSTRLPCRIGVPMWITSEACRWLPGSIWSYGARAVRVTRHGVSPALAAASLGWELLLTLLGWLVVAIVGFAVHRNELAEVVTSLPHITMGPLIAIATLVLAIGIGARKSLPLLRRKLLQRWQAIATVPRTAWVIVLIPYYVTLCCLSGWALSQIVLAICPWTSIPITAVLGANAFSWLVGFFTIFAPSGMIIRESALATVLVVWLPLESAIAIAVVWRGLQIVEELLLVTSFSITRWKQPLSSPLPLSRTRES